MSKSINCAGGSKLRSKKSKITRGVRWPSAQMRSVVSVRKNRWASPKDRRHALPRQRFIGSCPKCEKRLAAIHPSPPAHIAARDERRRSPAERTSALRSLFAPRACRCSFSQSKLKDMQQQRPRVPAASHHLSANADSTVFLLGFRRSYLFTATLHHHHRLRQRSGRHANVVCRISSLLHDHRLRSLGLELGRRHSTIASLCH